MRNQEKYKTYNNLASKFYNEVFEIINNEFQQEKLDKYSKWYFGIAVLAVVPLLVVVAQFQRLVYGLFTGTSLQLSSRLGWLNILPIIFLFILICLIKKYTLDPLWKIQDTKYSKSDYKKHLFNIKQKICQSIPTNDVYLRLEDVIDEIKNNTEEYHQKRQFVLSGIIQLNTVVSLSPFFAVFSREDISIKDIIVLSSLIVGATAIVSIISYYRYFFKNVEPAFGRSLGEIETKNVIRDILYYRDKLDEFGSEEHQEFNNEEMLNLLNNINQETEKYKIN